MTIAGNFFPMPVTGTDFQFILGQVSAHYPAGAIAEAIFYFVTGQTGNYRFPDLLVGVEDKIIFAGIILGEFAHPLFFFLEFFYLFFFNVFCPPVFFF